MHTAGSGALRGFIRDILGRPGLPLRRYHEAALFPLPRKLHPTMPTWIQRLLIALAALLALLVLAAGVLVARFDGDDIRKLLEAQVAERTERTLKLDGPVGLALWPKVAVTLQGLHLSEAGKPDEFLRVDEARLAVRVLPLLSAQRLEVEAVSARGVQMTLRRDAQGRRNIDDLIALSRQDAAAAEDPAAPGKPLAFSVDGLAFDDLRLTVQDVPAKLDGQVQIERLRSGRLAEGEATPIELRLQAKLAEPPVDAALSLDGTLTFRLPADQPPSLAIEGMKLGLKGSALGVQAIDAQLAGALDWDGAQQALEARGLQLQLAARPAGAKIETLRLAVERLGFKPASQRIELARLALELKAALGPAEAAQQLVAQLDWPALSVEGQGLSGSPLSGSARLAGPVAGGSRELQMQLSSQAPSGRFEKIVVPGLKLALSGSEGSRQIAAQLEADLSLAPQPLALNLAPLKLQLDLKDPALPPLALLAQGRLSLQQPAGAPARQQAEAQLKGTLNGQAFDTTLEAVLGSGVPRLGVQASFGTLDLSSFLPPAPTAAASAPAPASAEGTAAADAQKVDLSPLKAVDATLKLRAGTLILPPHRIEQAEVAARLKDGKLDLSQLDGRAWGGRFQATAQADAGSGALALGLDANEVDLNAMLGALAGFDKLEGRGKLSTRLASRGPTVGALKQALGGTLALQMRDGAVRGINLAKTLRDWRGAIAGGDAKQASQASEKTDFSEVSLSFDIREGVARSKDLSAKSPFLRLSGEGLVDLGASRVDYVARATVTGTPQGQDGPEMAALKGLTVPVKLEGPFSAVSWRIRWSEVGKELLKRQALGAAGASGGGAALVDRLLGGKGAAAPADGASAPPAQPKDKVKDALKGLLGR